jgi:hypothetical protein
LLSEILCISRSLSFPFEEKNTDHTTEEQRFVVRFFLSGKGLNAKDIHKEMFPVYGGKCLSRKAVHNCLQKFSEGRSKVADEARPGTEVAENSQKTLVLLILAHG